MKRTDTYDSLGNSIINPYIDFLEPLPKSQKLQKPAKIYQNRWHIQGDTSREWFALDNVTNEGLMFADIFKLKDHIIKFESRQWRVNIKGLYGELVDEKDPKYRKKIKWN